MCRKCVWMVAVIVLGGQLVGCKTKKTVVDQTAQADTLVQQTMTGELPSTNAQVVYSPDGRVLGYNDNEIVGNLTGGTYVLKILYLPDETDTKPSFPGGDAAYKKYLTRSVKYPQEALRKKIQGSVKIGFTVNPDGSIVNAKVERKVNTLLDNEALRVVKAMPKWNPGLFQGKPVPVKMSVPVNFRLAVKKK